MNKEQVEKIRGRTLPLVAAAIGFWIGRKVHEAAAENAAAERRAAYDELIYVIDELLLENPEGRFQTEDRKYTVERLPNSASTYRVLVIETPPLTEFAEGAVTKKLTTYITDGSFGIKRIQEEGWSMDVPLAGREEQSTLSALGTRGLVVRLQQFLPTLPELGELGS